MTYPSEWHRQFGEKTYASARTILSRLATYAPFRSVVEVGCGNAHWTCAAQELGARDHVVIDGPWNDRTDLLVDQSNFMEADLALPLDVGRRFDLALCLEVAEHVQRASATTLVQSLAGLSDVILFGAAIPRQGGYGHVNEQWQSWWCEHFRNEGCRAFDVIRPSVWNDGSVHYWYRQNCVLYVAEIAPDILAAVRAYRAAHIDEWDMLDAVHPEKFNEIAEYDKVELPTLMRKLPRHILNRIAHIVRRAG